MSVRHQEQRREKIIELARQLWSEQANLELDQIDGTFYIKICRADDIARIYEEGKQPGRPPMHVDMQLKSIMPHSQAWYDRDRPGMRDAVVRIFSQTSGRFTPEGRWLSPTDYPKAGLYWIQLGVRNQSWRGEEVARSFYRARDEASGWRQKLGLPPAPLSDAQPPYSDDEAVSFIGVKLYRDGDNISQIPWDPSRENPNELPIEEFMEQERARAVGRSFIEVPELADDERRRWVSQEAVGEVDRLIREFPSETSSRDPMIKVSIPDPLPPKEAIAAYYDAVVINERRWHEHLRGAINGQDVATAIRTWAIGLLCAERLTFSQAITNLIQQRIIDSIISKTTFTRQRDALLNRVPEARDYLG